MAFKREGTHPFCTFFSHIHFMSWTSRFHGFGGPDVVRREPGISFFWFLFFCTEQSYPRYNAQLFLVDRAKVVMRRA